MSQWTDRTTTLDSPPHRHNFPHQSNLTFAEGATPEWPSTECGVPKLTTRSSKVGPTLSPCFPCRPTTYGRQYYFTLYSRVWQRAQRPLQRTINGGAQHQQQYHRQPDL
ncbi:hypothetical protein RRG08_065127 [Elysia crispata]|uniref:Uncharacterized protein n=1 Tax=Elysia crispata TaxID=231223 RepID=A0AAE0ZB13_9GAST|nr:hypothetical protein RRG08_065127 [Elysia crispata]